MLVLIVLKEYRNKNSGGGLKETYWILIWGTGCTHPIRDTKPLLHLLPRAALHKKVRTD